MRWLRRTRSGQRSRVMPFRLALVVAQNRQTSGRTPRNLGTTRRIHPLSAPLIPPAPPGHPSFMRHDPEAWRRHAFRYYRRIPPQSVPVAAPAFNETSLSCRRHARKLIVPGTKSEAALTSNHSRLSHVFVVAWVTARSRYLSL